MSTPSLRVRRCRLGHDAGSRHALAVTPLLAPPPSGLLWIIHAHFCSPSAYGLGLWVGAVRLLRVHMRSYARIDPETQTPPSRRLLAHCRRCVRCSDPETLDGQGLELWDSRNEMVGAAPADDACWWIVESIQSMLGRNACRSRRGFAGRVFLSSITSGPRQRDTRMSHTCAAVHSRRQTEHGRR